MSTTTFQTRFPFSYQMERLLPLPHNMVYFTKEQFVARLPLPSTSLMKQFFHFSKIPHTFIHLNVFWILIGYSVLDTL